jgi:hypothetical protein
VQGWEWQQWDWEVVGLVMEVMGWEVVEKVMEAMGWVVEGTAAWVVGYEEVAACSSLACSQ